MRLMLAMLALVAVCTTPAPAAAQSSAAEDRLIGKWSGPFEGDSTGTYTMTIARDAAQALGGTLDVAPAEGGGYTTTFKSVVVDDTAATLKYDTDGGEVQIDLTLDGDTFKGSWKVVDPASSSVASSGTLSGKKG